MLDVLYFYVTCYNANLIAIEQSRVTNFVVSNSDVLLTVNNSKTAPTPIIKHLVVII